MYAVQYGDKGYFLPSRIPQTDGMARDSLKEDRVLGKNCWKKNR